MKKIKLTYSPLYNAGDLLNKDLIEKLSGMPIVRSKVFDADMMAIGGAIYGLQYSDKPIRRILQYILGRILGSKPVYIWGSGFLYNHNNNGIYRKNIEVRALRGEKTKAKLADITGVTYNVPLADAGLLIDMFLEETVEKKYEIGLIPHMSQIDEPAIQEMKNQQGVLLIDIRRTPQEVVRDIASCKTIASSSLHGLIFADALHIPSLHITGETILPGGNFKFEDYYSCYGLEDNYWNLKKQGTPTVDDIISRYKIKAEVVEGKKRQLIECFPKFK